MQIDVQHMMPLLNFQLRSRNKIVHDAGIIHQDINAAHFSQNPRDNLLYFEGLTNIAHLTPCQISL